MTNAYEIMAATPADEPALRALFREVTLRGHIETAFEREPDFFAAAALAGHTVQVHLARETATGLVVGCGLRSLRHGWIGGTHRDFGYLGDLRLRPEHRGGRLLWRGFQRFRELHADGRAERYATVIFEGNTRAETSLTRHRAGLPAYRRRATLLCPSLAMRPRKFKTSASLRAARPDDIPELVALLNTDHAARDYAPFVTSQDLEGQGNPPGLSWRQMRLAEDKGRIVAALGWWDASPFKQVRLVAYHGPARLLWHLSAPLRWLGRGPLPPPGSRLKTWHACHYGSLPGETAAFRELLRSVLCEPPSGAPERLLLSLDARDPLASALSGLAQTQFRATVYEVGPGLSESTPVSPAASPVRLESWNL